MEDSYWNQDNREREEGQEQDWDSQQPGAEDPYRQPSHWQSPREGQLGPQMSRRQMRYQDAPRDPEGRIIDRSNGLRAFCFGLAALVFFPIGLNIIAPVAAIAFGIVQLKDFSRRKG